MSVLRRLASWRVFRMTLMGLCVLLVASAMMQGVALADGDPTGDATIEADPTAAVNFTWTLMAAFLVFFMQAGFALLEAGSVRQKSVANVLTKNVMDFLMCGMAFWAFGFAIMFGGSELGSGLADGNKLFGTSGWFLTGDAYDVTTIEIWMFQMVFAATAATIVSGTMAERTKINAYMAYSFLISAIIYPVYGHWVWGGGWLATMQHTCCRLRRLRRRAHCRRHGCPGRRPDAGTTHRQVRAGRQGALHPRSQHDAGGPRHADPVPRLVRL